MFYHHSYTEATSGGDNLQGEEARKGWPVQKTEGLGSEGVDSNRWQKEGTGLTTHTIFVFVFTVC